LEWRGSFRVNHKILWRKQKIYLFIWFDFKDKKLRGQKTEILLHGDEICFQNRKISSYHYDKNHIENTTKKSFYLKFNLKESKGEKKTMATIKDIKLIFKLLIMVKNYILKKNKWK